MAERWAVSLLLPRAVRKGGTVQITGVYGGRYNGFPLGDFFQRYERLPANSK
jgi:threonine dehydrogenase-like Zn-dependent dehydrogenase